jgi:tRNA1(Val) A37 N6-methylase TrmN6
MNETGRILRDITAADFKTRKHLDRARIFNDFAHHFGWRPSDYIEPEYALVDKTNGHLLVEHGLEHAAVLTFMSDPWRAEDLRPHEERALLGISYNNLVDSHLTIDQQYVQMYSNRNDPPKKQRWPVDTSEVESLSASHMRLGEEWTVGANLPALDTVLIETIDYWKRFLHDEIKCRDKNEAISALFNALIFVRAVEDHHRLTSGRPSQPLLERWRKQNGKTDLSRVLLGSLRAYRAGRGASSLLPLTLLTPFNRLDGSLIERLIADFYKVKRTPYEYNFALMSRHALSRIYEKYVALLRQERSSARKGQTLFPIDLPEAERNKAAGAIYTPQFIPRFFCRFVEDRIPARTFRDLQIMDPACGSGIFLRTFLERKTEHLDLTTADVTKCFKNVLGLDVDPNACQASRLSLALLHLMLVNRLPSAPKILNEEAIAFLQKSPALEGTFGVVVGNPPFVRLELQTHELQTRVRDLLSDMHVARPDLYLAILRVAMKCTKPNGFLALVLPHSFLLTTGAGPLREQLRKEFWLHCVVDLSAIRVFEDFSAYIILVVAQKKGDPDGTAPACRCVICQDFIGQALQDCLDNRTTHTPYYSVFDVDQDYFEDGPWILLGPSETMLVRRLRTMRRVSDFLLVPQGLITGSDGVFIMDWDQVPSGEEWLYAPLLPDREIERYVVPESTGKAVYYPYRDGREIPIEELQKAKKTWAYLNQHKGDLPPHAARVWPYLLWPRGRHLLQPKIVSPHLVLSPRFALDLTGKYAVSHGPFLVPREKKTDMEMLKFFTGVLNSSVVHWYLGTHAYRFSRGYVKLDPKYLRSVPVPDPSKVPPTDLTRIVELVSERMVTANTALDSRIDELVLNAYGMTARERTLLGAECK